MYSGNSVVVNFLMRFPVLIPVAAAVGIATVVPKEVPPPPPPAPIVAPAPAPIVLKPVETLCPPADKLTKAELAKLTPKERGVLKVRGCIKG
jgi:hypothetical protein